MYYPFQLHFDSPKSMVWPSLCKPFGHNPSACDYQPVRDYPPICCFLGFVIKNKEHLALSDLNRQDENG